jgi:NADH:ubiquinone oxidoreductase subunit E
VSERTIDHAVDCACADHGDHPANLIQILRAIQETLGYIPTEAQRRAAERLGLPRSRVRGVVSFYHLFRTEPRGEHTIRLCQGTACYVGGGDRILSAICRQLNVQPGGTTEDRRFTLETVACLGACALSPVMVLDGVYHGGLTDAKALEILDTTGEAGREVA